MERRYVKDIRKNPSQKRAISPVSFTIFAEVKALQSSRTKVVLAENLDENRFILANRKCESFAFVQVSAPAKGGSISDRLDVGFGSESVCTFFEIFRLIHHAPRRYKALFILEAFSISSLLLNGQPSDHRRHCLRSLHLPHSTRLPVLNLPLLISYHQPLRHRWL